MIIYGRNKLPIWDYTKRRMPDGGVRRLLDMGRYWIAWYRVRRLP